MASHLGLCCLPMSRKKAAALRTRDLTYMYMLLVGICVYFLNLIFLISCNSTAAESEVGYQ